MFWFYLLRRRIFSLDHDSSFRIFQFDYDVERRNVKFYFQPFKNASSLSLISEKSEISI